MRLGTYRGTDGARVISVTGKGWLDVAAALGGGAPWARDMTSLLKAGPEAAARVQEATDRASGPMFEPDLRRLCAPVPRPGKIFCIGLNYKEHAAETGARLPTAPEVFMRAATTLVGPRDPVPVPSRSERFDVESELCIVIGRPCRHATKENALDHVFGYTIFNDLSVRDFQRRGSQWTPGKNWDGSGPCGPFIVTPDELDDPSALDISSDIDGFALQHANTGNLIFDLPTLIEDLSRFSTLEPGDLIATGTPPGVGDARTPPVYLRKGQVARCTVQGIGSLENMAIDEGEWLRQREAGTV